MIQNKNTVLAPNMDTERYINAKSAAKQLRIRQWKIHKMVELGVLRGILTGPRWNRQCCIECDELRRLSPNGQIIVDHMRAATLLGLPRKRARKLLAEGIPPALLSPAVADSKVPFAIPVIEIDRLFQEIADHLPSEAPSSVPLRSFDSIMKGASVLGLQMKDIVSAMRSGRLPALYREANRVGLPAFHFSREAVALTFDVLLQQAVTAPTDTVPVSVAVKRLGISMDTVLWLMRKGLLEEGPGSRPKSIRLVAASIGAFQSRAVKTLEIARANDTSSAAVLRALTAEGVIPLAHPDGHIWGGYYFAREDISRIDIPHVVSKHALFRSKTMAEYKREWRKRKKAMKSA